MKKFKKGEIIQYQGDVNTKVYYVEAGLLRSYTIDENGKEHIFMFAPEGWIVADSLPPDSPCELFIDALEDSMVKVVEKEDDTIEHNESKLIKRISVLQKRIIMLLSSSATERYEYFLDTYPNISQRIPQKMIASFIGITPQALSTLRNEKASRN
ncbi:MAG: Crp/Fnr family transcriptional regulator [Gracilimonas sp.]|nr:Crp/Fnr family transcriptional regulator [Gracilimonas sp.]